MNTAQKWALGILGALLLIGGGAAVSFKVRGLRNNNPGNLRISGNGWIGKVPVDENTDGQFEQFYNAEDGIRALARNLLTYYNRGQNTVTEIINSWAPPVGADRQGNRYTQNTSAYVQAVAAAVGKSPQQTIDRGDVPALVSAIIKHENGLNPYSDAVLNRAIRRAGWTV